MPTENDVEMPEGVAEQINAAADKVYTPAARLIFAVIGGLLAIVVGVIAGTLYVDGHARVYVRDAVAETTSKVIDDRIADLRSRQDTLKASQELDHEKLEAQASDIADVKHTINDRIVPTLQKTSEDVAFMRGSMERRR